MQGERREEKRRERERERERERDTVPSICVTRTILSGCKFIGCSNYMEENMRIAE